MFVLEPAAQGLQSLGASEAFSSAYLPRPQAVQNESVGRIEYLPTAHAVHKVAPAAGPLFVIDPGGHLLHDAMLDAFEYVPGAQAAQETAAGLMPVLVIDPGWQLSQYDWPTAL